MNHFTAAAAALIATTAAANAGGIDRNQFTTGILFEEGTYAELSFGHVDPAVSGTGLGAGSGDVTPTYNFATLSYRQDITDQLSFAFVIDEPIGANVSYPGGTGYIFATSFAELESRQMTAILRYETANNMSVYGGIRAVQATGDVYVNVAGNFSYRLNTESDYGLGYMVGAAYERPDIAMRVALTYFSEVDLSLSGTEGAVLGGGVAPAAVPVTANAFDITLPQSVLLEAQSGIAADTLLFGSVRWTNWDGFRITPGGYPAGNLVEYNSDVWTYTLGVGRRLNENWSVSATVAYDTPQGGFVGNLGPTDGFTSVSLGAEYAQNNFTIAGGVRYIMVGDAETQLGGGFTSSFADNDAVAVGVRFGYQF